MNKHKNIVLFELINNNLGDRVIADTCKYIINSLDVPVDVNIQEAKLFPGKDIVQEIRSNIVEEFFVKVFGYLGEFYEFKKWQNSKKVQEYYESVLENADMVIVAGGGLIKYSREYFWDAIYSIISTCKKKNIPVYFNAVGIEGFNPFSFRCQLLKNSLSSNNVSITTRDDLKTLRKYIKLEQKHGLVGDPALYTLETYGAEKKENDVIGVGLIRGHIFVDYNIKWVRSRDIVQTYVGIIRELESRGYKWQLFCNGVKSDYQVGKFVLKELNLPVDRKYLLKRPVKPNDLVDTISSYKATISARLHASIIALSLGIPNVGLVWNDKLKIFGEIFGIQNRFIKRKNFKNSKYIVDQLEEALQNKYNETKIAEFKELTKQNLKDFVLSNCDTAKTLVAVERERERERERVIPLSREIVLKEVA